MSQLTISLLGDPQITLDGAPIQLQPARAIPLIAYLAISGKSQTREKIANFLWTDSNQRQAMAALRTTLWRLKSLGLQEWISMDRNEIDLNRQKNVEIDVVNYKTMLEKCTLHGHLPSQICLYCTSALTEAVSLYRGDFMSGFNISKAPVFDDWRMQQSETFLALQLDALERLVKCHRAYGDLNLAINYARIWLSHDRMNENANFQLLQLYSITGQRTAGLALYHHYKEILSREFSVEPSAELTSLYKQLHSGQSAPNIDHKVKNPIFLIAEIDNAAEYWAKVGSQKNDFMTAHLNILRDTSRRFGGRIIQKSDENVTILFENGQPLHCAVTIHMKIRKTDWGLSGPPGMRMVLYSTAVEGENPSSFATLTRTASSLLSISWSGQVVFSDQTLRLLDMPSGSRVKDLGFLFLDSVDGLLHVYELVHPNLSPQEHPPLQSRTQQIINFPVLSPAFIGREQELTELHRLFSGHDTRLVSLIGPGGIGKTRLAIQFASEIAKDYPDGVYFISLASIQDPDFIPILLSEALRFTFYGPKNQNEQLSRFLHRKKVLLVLDNFEHLRVEGAKQLAVLLSQTHYLKILVTTRERLNMIAETIMELHGLPVPTDPDADSVENYSSVKLFIQNAQKIYPKFAYLNSIASIIQICQQVDGIPLGILLASSWVRVFSCPEITAEIKKNIDFLSSTASDIDPRHHSLRAVFDNSWELLTEDERRVLSRLSIFQATFTLQAAQEICGATQLSLATFIDKSLLFRRQDNRYEMLTTFRQYASGKLEENHDEHVATITKFCDYFAEFCDKKQQQINSPALETALSEFSVELENIRTTWKILIDSDRWDVILKIKDPLLAYHGMLGSSIQGREFFRLALNKLNKQNDPELEVTRACMLQISAWMTIRNGFVSEGVPGLLESLEVFRRHGEDLNIAITLMFLSESARLRGNNNQARVYIEEGLEILNKDALTKTDYVVGFTAHCRAIYGSILIELGQFPRAREQMNASLATHSRNGTSYGRILPLMGLGKMAYIEGEFTKAKDLFLQALETATKIYDRRGMAQIHNNLGSVYEEIANISESYQHVTSALKLSRETGDRRLTAVIINNLAFHQMRYFRQPTEAIRTYQECIELFSEIGDLRGITYTCYDISRAYLDVGLLDEAQSYCLRSLQTAITLDSTPLILHSLHGFVYLFTHTRDCERALRLCNLIINHPLVDSDTRKRAIVSKVDLEAALGPEITHSARQWGETANLQDVIDRILISNSVSKNVPSNDGVNTFFTNHLTNS